MKNFIKTSIGIIAIVLFVWIIAVLMRTSNTPTESPAITDDVEIQEQTVQLYYYDSDLDMDENGNIMCSEKGLVAVDRQIPVTQTPIQDTINLLLEGNLTRQEIEGGITTEYPLGEFSLEGAALTNGVLNLAFDDPNNETVGGSCRTGILWAQINKTALQFDAVQEVRFEPEDLFQP